MSNQDLYLVLGIIITGFSIPSILGAMADRKAPRVATVTVVIGLGLVLLAVSQQSYTLHGIPEAFIRVVAHFVR